MRKSYTLFYLLNVILDFHKIIQSLWMMHSLKLMITFWKFIVKIFTINLWLMICSRQEESLLGNSLPAWNRLETCSCATLTHLLVFNLIHMPVYLSLSSNVHHHSSLNACRHATCVKNLCRWRGRIIIETYSNGFKYW